MTVPVSPTDLFFIVVSAAIVGGVLAAGGIAAMIRYSRNEENGTENYSKSFQDIGLILLAAAFTIYGAYVAGLFG